VTQFHKQAFNSRFNMMGDPAEAVFDEMHPKHHKLGLNRPPFGMGGMNAAMRYVPDRMTRFSFVEIMGIGADRLLKLKDEKIDALMEWCQLGPVELFVWDKHTDLTYCTHINQWRDAIESFGTPGTFSEGKAFKALHVEHFPVSPIPRQANVAA
jgi:hypothetical protein